MLLALFFEFHGITQQPYGSFPLESFKKKHQKTNQTKLYRGKPHDFTFSILVKYLEWEKKWFTSYETLLLKLFRAPLIVAWKWFSRGLRESV